MTTIQQYLKNLAIFEDFIPMNGITRTGETINPTHITIHNTSNDQPGADAVAHNKYIRSHEAVNVRKVSWHFTVDDKCIFHHLPYDEKAIHAGQGNSKSIGIEICMHRGIKSIDAYNRAAALTAFLLHRKNIHISNVVQHHFWTGKNCPIQLRATGGGWEAFLSRTWDEYRALSTLRFRESGERGLVYNGTVPSHNVSNETLSLIDGAFSLVHDENEGHLVD